MDALMLKGGEVRNCRCEHGISTLYGETQGSSTRFLYFDISGYTLPLTKGIFATYSDVFAWKPSFTFDGDGIELVSITTNSATFKTKVNPALANLGKPVYWTIYETL